MKNNKIDDFFTARQQVEKSQEAVQDKEDQLKMDKMSKKDAKKFEAKRQKEKRKAEKEKEDQIDEETHKSKIEIEKKQATAQKHHKKEHHKKRKHFKIKDDPSEKIEETLTERAVIHKAVTKINSDDGEDLINNFITEADSTSPSETSNSWLSQSLSAPIEGQTDDGSSTQSVAQTTTESTAAP